MNERFRPEDRHSARQPVARPAVGPSSELASASALLDAADAAIHRALSQNSEQFLANARQNGGQ